MTDLKEWIKGLDEAATPATVPRRSIGEPVVAGLHPRSHRVLTIAAAFAIGAAAVGLAIFGFDHHAPGALHDVSGRIVGGSNPQAPPPAIMAMDFVDANHGFLVRCAPAGANACAHRELLITTDGGSTWTPRASNGIPQQIDFISTTMGFGVGADCLKAACPTKVSATSDGGRTWRPLAPLGVSSRAGMIPALSFVDASNGWVTADQGIYRTTNGGVSWSRLSFRCPYSSTLTGLSFVSVSGGWAICESEPATDLAPKVLLRTMDGGITWTTVARSGFKLFGTSGAPDIGRISSFGYNARVLFLTPQVGFLLTDRGGVDETTNGGRTFHTVFLDEDTFSPVGVWLQGNTGYLGLYQGLILSTNDGGSRWTQRYPAPTFAVTAPFAFSAGGTGIALGSEGVAAGRLAGPANALYATSDFGARWSRLSQQPGASWLEMPTPGVAYALKPGGSHRHDGLYRSSDVGATWHRVPTPGASAPMQMTFFDALNGFIRLRNDAVYRTSDGGATWTSVGRETNIIGFQAASMSDLWAFPLGSNGGSTGGIVRSTNGGVTWTNVSTVPSFRAQGLALLDPQHVWVEGVICASPISTPSPSVPPKPQPCRDARSVLLRSSDGGSTWQTIDLPSLPDSIMFVSPSVGYGMTSQLLITRDGGVTWRPVKYSLRP